MAAAKHRKTESGDSIGSNKSAQEQQMLSGQAAASVSRMAKARRALRVFGIDDRRKDVLITLFSSVIEGYCQRKGAKNFESILTQDRREFGKLVGGELIAEYVPEISKGKKEYYIKIFASDLEDISGEFCDYVAKTREMNPKASTLSMIESYIDSNGLEIEKTKNISPVILCYEVMNYGDNSRSTNTLTTSRWQILSLLEYFGQIGIKSAKTLLQCDYIGEYSIKQSLLFYFNVHARACCGNNEAYARQVMWPKGCIPIGTAKQENENSKDNQDNQDNQDNKENTENRPFDTFDAVAQELHKEVMAALGHSHDSSFTVHDAWVSIADAIEGIKKIDLSYVLKNVDQESFDSIIERHGQALGIAKEKMTGFDKIVAVLQSPFGIPSAQTYAAAYFAAYMISDQTANVPSRNDIGQKYQTLVQIQQAIQKVI